MKARHSQKGYILLETVVALTLLSITMLTVNTAIRQAVLLEGLARDFTDARLLLERLVADIEMQEQVTPRAGSGAEGRFEYEWAITQERVPPPRLPGNVSELDRTWLERSFNDAIGKVRVVIRWTRAGVEQEVVGETLLRPDQLWTEPRT